MIIILLFTITFISKEVRAGPPREGGAACAPGALAGAKARLTKAPDAKPELTDAQRRELMNYLGDGQELTEDQIRAKKAIETYQSEEGLARAKRAIAEAKAEEQRANAKKLMNAYTAAEDGPPTGVREVVPKAKPASSVATPITSVATPGNPQPLGAMRPHRPSIYTDVVRQRPLSTPNAPASTARTESIRVPPAAGADTSEIVHQGDGIWQRPPSSKLFQPRASVPHQESKLAHGVERLGGAPRVAEAPRVSEPRRLEALPPPTAPRGAISPFGRPLKSSGKDRVAERIDTNFNPLATAKTETKLEPVSEPRLKATRPSEPEFTIDSRVDRPAITPEAPVAAVTKPASGDQPAVLKVRSVAVIGEAPKPKVIHPAIAPTEKRLGSMIKQARKANQVNGVNANQRQLIINSLKDQVEIFTKFEADLTPAQFKLLREARLRIEILSHVEEPHHILVEGVIPEGATLAPVVRHHTDPAWKPTVDSEAQPLMSNSFTSEYDPTVPHESAVMGNGVTWHAPSLKFGDAMDPYGTGHQFKDAEAGLTPAQQQVVDHLAPVQLINPPPTGYRARDVNVPFTVEDTPFHSIRIPPASEAQRLQNALEPGEWATLMFSDGGNKLVYYTHAKPPDEILAQGFEATRAWVSEHRYRTAKVWRTEVGQMNPVSVEFAARRDFAMRQADKQRADRVRMKNELGEEIPVYSVNEVEYSLHTQKTGEYDGIEFEPPVTGRKLDEIQLDILEYNWSGTSADRKQEIRNQFRAERMPPPEQMAKVIGANDQADRDFHTNAINLGKANNMIKIGHQKEVDVAVETIEDGKKVVTKTRVKVAIEHGFDRAGSNKKFNPETGGPTGYDR